MSKLQRRYIATRFKIENDKWMQWQNDYLIYCIRARTFICSTFVCFEYTLFAYFIMDLRSKLNKRMFVCK